MNKLRIARAIRKICQHRLAFLVGVGQSTISIWENGFRQPTEQQKQKIARALNFPVEELWPKSEGSNQGGENA